MVLQSPSSQAYDNCNSSGLLFASLAQLAEQLICSTNLLMKGIEYESKTVRYFGGA
jgi:hypothetical protein